MKKTIYRGHEIEIFTVGTVADSFLGTMKYFGLIDGEGGPQTENFKSAEEALAEARHAIDELENEEVDSGN